VCLGPFLASSSALHLMRRGLYHIQPHRWTRRVVGVRQGGEMGVCWDSKNTWYDLRPRSCFWILWSCDW
jgi:hypothetical protein